MLVHFIAWPGIEEVVSKSPGSIAPFSFVALTGTLPEIASSTSPLLPPNTAAGSVEITPIAF